MTTRPLDRCDDALTYFIAARPRLFAIAQRILDNRAEAEDVLQDVWLRWQRCPTHEVVNAASFLAVITMRLSLNRARSLRVRQLAHRAVAFAEATDLGSRPAICVEHKEQLELAIAMLLERLSARERAAYVLRVAFSYPYLQIAALLRVTEAASRQLVTRASRHIAEQRYARVGAQHRRRLLDAFTSAAQSGEVAQLEGLFAPDGRPL
ncbi:MAG TPA: sigma-70 family RNA polymerase sigma factor [Polyangiales bacterium]